MKFSDLKWFILIAVLLLGGWVVWDHPTWGNIWFFHKGYRLYRQLEQGSAELKTMNESCRKSEQMVSAIKDINLLTADMVEPLGKIAGSKTLGLLGQIPIIGGCFSVMQTQAAIAGNILAGLRKMEELDDKYYAPLRRVVAVSHKFLEKKEGKQIPELVAAYDEGIIASESLRLRLDKLLLQTAAAKRLLAKAGLFAAQKQIAPELKDALVNLQEAVRQIDTLAAELKRNNESALLFMQQISKEGHAVLGDKKS